METAATEVGSLKSLETNWSKGARGYVATLTTKAKVGMVAVLTLESKQQ